MISSILYFLSFAAAASYEKVLVDERTVLDLKKKYKNPAYDDLFVPIRDAAVAITSTPDFLPPEESF